MSDNVVTFCGTLTRDPELRFTQGGRAVANFGMAVNRRFQVNNEWQEEVMFLNGVAWSTLAENLAQSTFKGARIVVTGRLQQRNYETQSGEKRQVIELVADDIGASLKWATAEITKTERNTGQNSTAGRGGQSYDSGDYEGY